MAAHNTLTPAGTCAVRAVLVCSRAPAAAHSTLTPVASGLGAQVKDLGLQPWPLGVRVLTPCLECAQ
jgi:hypothetical protein